MASEGIYILLCSFNWASLKRHFMPMSCFSYVNFNSPVYQVIDWIKSFQDNRGKLLTYVILRYNYWFEIKHISTWMKARWGIWICNDYINRAHH